MEPTVAVIDSGIDYLYFQKHRNMFIGTFTPLSDNDCENQKRNQFPADLNGHGTMVISTIHALNPSSKFLVLKILNQDCLATTASLVEALRYLCKQQIDIIHLSMSVTRQDRHTNEIINLCNQLTQQGKIIVCSVENRKSDSFPANLPVVLGVAGGLFSSTTDYDFDINRRIQFVCDVTPSVVYGLYNKPSIFSGTSKAACIATSVVADAMQKQNWNSSICISNLLPNVVKSTSYFQLSGGDIPQIQGNREINFDGYEWCAGDFFKDVCGLFQCDQNTILSNRLIDVCDDLCGEIFDILWADISQKLNITVRPDILHYISFEWLWCLFEYIDQIYRREKSRL